MSLSCFELGEQMLSVDAARDALIGYAPVAECGSRPNCCRNGATRLSPSSAVTILR